MTRRLSDTLWSVWCTIRFCSSVKQKWVSEPAPLKGNMSSLLLSSGRKKGCVVLSYTLFGITLREACATLLCVYCVWRHVPGSMCYLAVGILCLASRTGKHAGRLSVVSRCTLRRPSGRCLRQPPVPYLLTANTLIVVANFFIYLPPSPSSSPS